MYPQVCLFRNKTFWPSAKQSTQKLLLNILMYVCINAYSFAYAQAARTRAKKLRPKQANRLNVIMCVSLTTTTTMTTLSLLEQQIYSNCNDNKIEGSNNMWRNLNAKIEKQTASEELCQELCVENQYELTLEVKKATKRSYRELKIKF